MIEKLVFHSSNYVYVYIVGIDKDSIVFLGTTKEDYRKAKGSFKAYAFIRTSDSLDCTISQIEEDFNLPKDVDKNISKGVKREESIKCAKEFYNEIMPRISELVKGMKEFTFIASKFSGKGFLCKKPFSDIHNSIILEKLDVLYIIDRLSGVYDVSELLEAKVKNSKAPMSIRDNLNSGWNGECDWCVLSVSENDTVSLVSYCNLVGTEDIEDLEKILETVVSNDIKYSLCEEAYYLA